MPRILQAVFLSSIFLTSTIVSAAPVHIEVIVFAHGDGSSKNPEWFLKPSETIVVEDINLTSGVDLEPDSVSEETPRPVASIELTNVAKALDEHPNYTILNYLSWVQEPVRKNHTIPVSLDVEHSEISLTPQLLLSGEISLYEVQLILQLEIDATYSPTLAVEQGTVYLPKPVTLYSKGTEYKLNERRQVQIGDLHYFDHPKFGVIFYMVRPKKTDLSSNSTIAN